jgi:hypothetical protein
MELEELKNRWNEFDNKLEKSLQLNKQLLKQINLDKAKNKIRTLLIFKLLETGVLSVVVYYLVKFTIYNFTSLQFSVSALILLFFTVMGYISTIRQVSLMIRLKTEDADDITSKQKKLTGLKLLIAGYVKWGLLSIPFFPVWIILIPKIFLNFDMYTNGMNAWWWANIGLGLLLIPFVLWVFNQLSKKNINQFWVKNLLEGSGWGLAADAENFLTEIEKFEQEG